MFADKICHCQLFLQLFLRRRQSVYVPVVAVNLLVAESGHCYGCESVEVEAGPHVFSVEGAEYAEEEGKDHVVPKDSR